MVSQDGHSASQGSSRWMPKDRETAVTKELQKASVERLITSKMKNKFGGDSCSKESHSRRTGQKAVLSCAGVVVRSSVRQIGSVERVSRGFKGEANDIRSTPGRESSSPD